MSELRRLCPHHYKITVIKTFSTEHIPSALPAWELFHDELRRIKQVLINNNFHNYIIDKQITKLLNCNMKSNNLTDDVRRVEHQTPQIKMN